MTRKRVPTKVLEARGAFRKNPNRRRDHEPEGVGVVGSPPESFSKEERAVWQDILERAPCGVLTGSDWFSVVLATRLWAKYMAEPESFNAALIARMYRIFGDLGCNPVDRASMHIPKPKEPNPFEQFS